MNESSGLQRVARRFIGHPRGSELAEFLIYQGEQFASGVRIARLCPIQDKSHGAHDWITAEDYYKEEKITTPLNSSRFSRVAITDAKWVRPPLKV